MGTWSVDVFGGDKPLDVLGEIGDVIGEQMLYPVESLDARAKTRVRTKLNFRESEILAHFHVLGDRYEPNDYLPVWAALTMSVGGRLSAVLREGTSAAASALAKDVEDWRHPEERAAYMNGLGAMIRSYQTGDKVDLGHKGLFQTIAEGEATRRDS